MKRTSLVATAMLIVALFATNTVFAQTPAEYKTKIEAINKDITKWMLEGNVEKSMSLYTPEAISLPSYEPMHVGIDAIKKAQMDMTNSGWKPLSFEVSTQKVIVNDSMITEIGTYKISMTMPNMPKPMDDHGKYLTIWEKQKDGSLKIKVETWNTDVNPMSMMSTSDNK